MDDTSIKYELPDDFDNEMKSKDRPYVFSSNAHKSDVFNPPLLVIGLGGSGYEALSRAKEKMFSCFVTNSKGELDGVEFLEIDTDDRDKKTCLGNSKPGSLTESEFLIFQSADIGAILRSRKDNPDVLPKEIVKWLDPHIPVAQIVHGAAGIRQAGRLLLHLNAIEIIDVIKDKLDKIRQSVVLSKSPVNVVIFTGIGGGTGSGTFVDISYIVRECIKQFSGQAFITGIILMPDILAGDPNVDKNTQENIKRNGFAALKELDYLMNLSETQDTFSQSFPGGFLVEETSDSIFDRCVLVSSMIEGRLLLPHAKEHAYNTAAEMLIDMVSNSSFVSKGSNEVSLREYALANFKDRKPVNYLYTAVGGQAVYFDFDMVFDLFIKNVLEYEINKVYSRQEIEKRVDKTMEDKGIQDSIDELSRARLRIVTANRNLYELVDTRHSIKTGKRETKQVSKSDIRNHPNRKYEITENKDVRDAYDTELQEFDRKGTYLCEKLRRVYAATGIRDDAYIAEMKNRVLEALNNTIDKTVSWSEESELQKLSKEIEAYRKDCEKQQENKSGGLLQRLSSPNIRVGKPKDIREPAIALQEINELAAQRIRDEAYNKTIGDLTSEIGLIFVPKHEEDSETASPQMLSFYNMARDKWKDILNAKYDINNTKNNDLKESVETTWEMNDGIVGEATIVQGDRVNYDFRGVTVKAYISAVEKLIQENLQLVDPAAIEYKKKMTDNSLTELYQGETGVSWEISTARIFDSYLMELIKKKQRDDVIINLDQLIMILFGVKKPELEKVWEDVVRTILNHFGVLYSKKAMKDGEVFEKTNQSEFMIPRGCKGLASAYKSITGKKAEESEIRHRISYMNYTQCQTIDDYIYIDVLEDVYNRSNSKCGLHLYERKSEDGKSENGARWAKLPSPVYRNRQADYRKKGRYDDARTALKYRYVFDCAVHNHIIMYDRDIRKMYIDTRTIKENLDSYISPEEERVYICNLENNESKRFYYNYCSNWFIKMFRYRDFVAKALDINVADISDETLDAWFTNTQWQDGILNSLFN